MADNADLAGEVIERAAAAAIARAVREAADIPPGVEGVCESCGENSARLIGGDCARCRDKKEKR